MRKEALAIITTASLLTGCSAIGMERASESIKTTTVTVYPTPDEFTTPTGVATTPEQEPTPALTPTDVPTFSNKPNQKINAVESISKKRLGAFVLFVVENGKPDVTDPNRWIFTLNTKSGPITEYVAVDENDSTKASSITIEYGKPRGGMDSGPEPMSFSTSNKMRGLSDGYYKAPYDPGFYAGKPAVADGVVDKYSGYGFGNYALPLPAEPQLDTPIPRDESLAAKNAQHDYERIIDLTLNSTKTDTNN